MKSDQIAMKFTIFIASGHGAQESFREVLTGLQVDTMAVQDQVP